MPQFDILIIFSLIFSLLFSLLLHYNLLIKVVIPYFFGNVKLKMKKEYQRLPSSFSFNLKVI